VVSGEIAARALIGDASAFTALLKVQHAREATQQEAEESRSVLDDDAEEPVNK
jgi:hypothetical protein